MRWSKPSTLEAAGEGGTPPRTEKGNPMTLGTLRIEIRFCWERCNAYAGNATSEMAGRIEPASAPITLRVDTVEPLASNESNTDLLGEHAVVVEADSPVTFRVVRSPAEKSTAMPAEQKQPLRPKGIGPCYLKILLGHVERAGAHLPDAELIEALIKRLENTVWGARARERVSRAGRQWHDLRTLATYAVHEYRNQPGSLI